MTPEDQRKHRMGILARAPEGRITDLLETAGLLADKTFLRPPEIGSVMVRGRAGGKGDAFNLGEVTVTRCTLRLDCGTVGHAYIQGRRKSDAEAAALVDALLQTDKADATEQAVIQPLLGEEQARRAARAEKAAATKVEFFTMARGSD